MPHSPPALSRNAKAMHAIKNLAPQDPGARRWVAEFGDRLLCVRYRADARHQRRQTTVELVVDEAPTLGSARVGLRIAWAEKELPQRVKESGGKWDAQAGPWMLPPGAVRQLGLAERIVRVHERNRHLHLSTCRRLGRARCSGHVHRSDREQRSVLGRRNVYAR